MWGTTVMKVLVWQWSRFGGPPLVAVNLAEGLAALPGVSAALSLSTGAELLHGPNPPRCDLPVDTYASLPGFLARLATAPFAAPRLARRIAALQPDLAVCAQPGPLDLLMATALRRLDVPMVVLVHDADHHPGDGLPLQMQLQRALCRRADAVGALCGHVAARLLEQRLAGTPGRALIRLHLPPLPSRTPAKGRAPDGSLHLLCFGRLLRYKGLDLLAAALARLGPRPSLVVRVVGSGPESRELALLRSIPGVGVENRWVPEQEVGALLAWADAVVLPYREASQSGVAALALAAGRRVVSTRVGGLAEQLGGEPLATLCEPDPVSLADALLPLAASPALPLPPTPDSTAAWRSMAGDLLRVMPMLPQRHHVPGLTLIPA